MPRPLSALLAGVGYGAIVAAGLTLTGGWSPVTLLVGGIVAIGWFLLSVTGRV